MKKVFKKQNMIDTAVSVGIGGAANAVVDIALASANIGIGKSWKDVGKFIIGAAASAAIGSKLAKDAFNGLAVVGASNLVSDLVGDGTDFGTGSSSSGNSSGNSSENTTITGVPYGTVGKRARMGFPNYIRRVKTSGVSSVIG